MISDKIPSEVWPKTIKYHLIPKLSNLSMLGVEISFVKNYIENTL